MEGPEKPFCFSHCRRIPSVTLPHILLIIIIQIITWYAHFNTRDVIEGLCLTQAESVKDFKTHTRHVSKP